MSSKFRIARRVAMFVVVAGIIVAVVGNALLRQRNTPPGAGHVARYFGLTVAVLGLATFLFSSVTERIVEKRLMPRRLTATHVPPRRLAVTSKHRPITASIVATRVMSILLFVLAGLTSLNFLWSFVSMGLGMGFAVGLPLLGMLLQPAALATLGMALWVMADMVQDVARIAGSQQNDSVKGAGETVAGRPADIPIAAKVDSADILPTEKET